MDAQAIYDEAAEAAWQNGASVGTSGLPLVMEDVDRAIARCGAGGTFYLPAGQTDLIGYVAVEARPCNGGADWLGVYVGPKGAIGVIFRRSYADRAEDPKFARPTISDILPRLVAYLRRPGDLGGGGSLHVYTDGNDGPGILESCAEYARERGDAEGEALARAIAGMSRTQRRKLSARAGDAAWRAGPMAVEE